MLDVTRLRVLVAVARCGSVTAAARALNYAQPSVSHHLARLEAETGTKLIQRAGRGISLTEGLRERLLLEEEVHLVTSAQGAAEPSADLSGYARHRWIAGCDRCRANLLRQCALAGFTPRIAFTTDDYIAVQALVAADLGVSTLPALCLRAARHPGIRTVPLPGAHRFVLAVRYGDPPDPPAVNLLMEVLRTAAVPPPRPAGSGAVSGAGSAAGGPAQQQSPAGT